MKVFQIFALSLAFILVFSILAVAQTEKTKPTASKEIVIIFPIAFKDKKNGIKELVNAYDKLEVEFKPQDEEINLMFVKIQNLEKEIKQTAGMIEPPPTLTKEFIDSKIKEYELLIRKFKTRRNEIKSLYEKRESEIVGEINKRIVQALKEFAKEKGYTAILDASKLILSENGFCVSYNENLNVTKEFIKFYNEIFSEAKSQ